MVPELGKRLRGFRWKLAGIWVLIVALLLVVNVRFVSAQLDNDDALRQDMRLVVDSVANQCWADQADAVGFAVEGCD